MMSASRRLALVAAAVAFAAPGAQAAGLPLGTVPGKALLLSNGFIQVQDAREMPPRQGAALVTAIQEELRRHGHDPGPADGVFGGKTRNAIRAYQRDTGLRVDGQPTKELLDHLKFASRPGAERAAAPKAEAERPRGGAARNLVLDVQRELSVRGYYRFTLDGIDGAGTKAAVRAFQRDAGFPVTGTIDERLLAELRVVDSNIRADRTR